MIRPIDRQSRRERSLPSCVSRFAKDRRANTLMLTAAVMMPMLGIVGAAVDMSRGYMAKSRLQQACDAGVLAGRRAMTNNQFTTAAQTQAREMFQFNFPLGQYSSSAVAFTPTMINSSDIMGTATATIPQSIMYIVGMKPFNLSVECTARQEISNTDIMLVLDTTGSMEETNAGDTTSRITGLQTAAMNFFDTLMSAATDDGIIRFGIVPYNESVNTRALMYSRSADFIADSVVLPSRRYGGKTYDGYHYYNYDKFTISSPLLKEGGSIQLRTGDGNSLQTHTAINCLMEPDTVPIPLGGTAPSTAYDMDIDHVPTTAIASKFKVMVPSFFYTRSSGLGAAYQPGYDYDRPNIRETSTDYYDCPTAPARKLTRLRVSDRSTFKGWIDGLVPDGGTIHTAGMAWGARLLSPDGMFASENRTATNGRPISRHIIFMTDGEMDARMWRYGYQGMEDHMTRLGGSSDDNLGALSRERFLALCTQAKAKDITIWVLNFGDQAGPEVSACATPGKFLPAKKNAELNTQFQSIARQISRLRLTK